MNRKNLISKNFPKKIKIKEDILKKLILEGEKEKFVSLEEEVKYKIDKKIGNIKINEIKKYLPLEMETEFSITTKLF